MTVRTDWQEVEPIHVWRVCDTDETALPHVQHELNEREYYGDLAYFAERAAGWSTMP